MKFSFSGGGIMFLDGMVSIKTWLEFISGDLINLFLCSRPLILSFQVREKSSLSMDHLGPRFYSLSKRRRMKSAHSGLYNQSVCYAHLFRFGFIYLLGFESPVSRDASANEVGASVLLSVRPLINDFHMRLKFSTLRQFSSAWFLRRSISLLVWRWAGLWSVPIPTNVYLCEYS